MGAFEAGLIFCCAPVALQQEQAEEACAQKCSMEVEEEAAPEPAVEVNEASEEPPQPPESKVIDLRPPVGYDPPFLPLHVVNILFYTVIVAV